MLFTPPFYTFLSTLSYVKELVEIFKQKKWKPMAFLTKEVSTEGYDVSAAQVYSSHGPLKPPDLFALMCSKCKLILREPKQVIVCGHRYCKQCIEQMTSGRYSFHRKIGITIYGV